MSSRKAVACWLLLIALMIAGMVVIGGLTRLTGSGLSITEWRPVTGVIPPLNTGEWLSEFHKYQQIPQYKLENRGMTLSRFQFIYWWEWTHRLLGRLIGIVFLIPLLFFTWTGAIGRRAIPRMVTLFVLGGLQGFVGWWMVASGLETRVSVSQYRLAIHLGTALILFAAILWTAFEYFHQPLDTPRPVLSRRGVALAALVYCQMLLGALVAGLHAGLMYNTWPSMDGRFGPEHPFFVRPWWANPFENPGLAQFDHRIGAYLVGLFAFIIWWRGVREGRSVAIRASAHAVLTIVIVQVGLGVETLLNQAPTTLSALHQTTALALFSAAVWHAFELSRVTEEVQPSRHRIQTSPADTAVISR